MPALITLMACVSDAIIGDPPSWPHPVRLIGRLITRGEGLARAWAGGSPERLYRAGVLLTLGTVLATSGAVFLLLRLAAAVAPPLRFLTALYLVFALLCLKDLRLHSRRVEEALRNGHLDEARRRLSLMVGRDTAALSEAEMRRALIETLAENLSDGLIAPLFYLALGGPVLAWGFKAVNTLDSMIGYKNGRYLHLGRFAAKLDDAAGFIPARLSVWLLVGAARLSGRDWRAARHIARRDGGLHPSPNAGRPEAAMAGALGLWLGGPSTYGGALSEKPKLNAAGGEPRPRHVDAAENLVAGAAWLGLFFTLLAESLGAGRWGW